MDVVGFGGEVSVDVGVGIDPDNAELVSGDAAGQTGNRADSQRVVAADNKGKIPFAKPSCTLSASWRQVAVTSSRYFMVGSVFLFSGLGGMPISEIPLTWLPHRSASDEILFLENAIGPR